MWSHKCPKKYTNAVFAQKIFRCRRNLFCSLSKKIYLHTIKCQILSVFQHQEQVKFSEIFCNKIIFLSKQCIPLQNLDQMRTFAREKKHKIGFKYDRSSATHHTMWHIWGHLKTVTTIIKLGTVPSPHPWITIFSQSEKYRFEN